MNNYPTVAVLIPTKNRQAFLERALKSVFEQTIHPDEIIVVNDGSTDGTKEYLKLLEYPGLKIINYTESRGVNAARNEGIKIIKSDWIAWLDDDDELFAEAIERIKKCLANIPDSCFVANFNTVIKKNGTTFNGGFQLREGEEFEDLDYQGWMLIKSRLKGDCKPVVRRILHSEKDYWLPESVNGFESYFFNLVARDGWGIRCYRELSTIIHQETAVGDRLSLSASAKNPWNLFTLHFQQIFQHWKFYIKHPLSFGEKMVAMSKLLVRSALKLFS